MPETDLLAALGALVAAQDPPSAALDEAALCLVDTLACILAGRDEDVAVAARRAMASASGPGPARAIGGDARMSLPAAALANGVAAHAIDLDDYEIPGSTHPSAVVLGALLALATTRAATLREVLVAHVAGHEAIVRMGEALGHGHYLAGWHATSTIGPFGAATACPRLLGLGAEATAHALGLAASASAGLKHQFGSDAKPVHAGFAARAGSRRRSSRRRGSARPRASSRGGKGSSPSTPRRPRRAPPRRSHVAAARRASSSTARCASPGSAAPTPTGRSRRRSESPPCPASRPATSCAARFAWVVSLVMV